MTDELLDLAQSVVARALPGEGMEVYVTRGTDTEVRAYEGEVESLSSAETQGMGVRVAARGSGAGSLVTYLLGISDVDPLRYRLLMERFLSGRRSALPDINIDVPVEPTQSTAITDVTDKHLPPAPAPHVSNKTNPTTGKNFPNSADYYPAASMRLGEEGSAIVHACVAPTGKLSEDPTIAKTSGSSRLDEGAIKLAKAGHYVAGSEDGKPTTGCFNMSIKFQLKN